MTDRLTEAVTHARRLVAELNATLAEKAIWGSPMGKKRLAERLASLLPAHKTYVEPFAGSAAVLFAKEPSEVEVLGDVDPEISFAFQFAKDVTPEQLARLRRKKWVGDKEHFTKLLDAGVPEDELERFYRFAYLARFSFNKLRRGTMPEANVGAHSRFVEKLERYAPRLKHVELRCADYEEVVDELDGPDTFFFFDPPYAGYNADACTGAAHKGWDEERFARVLRRLKGRFLCTYGLRGSNKLFKDFVVQRWRHTSGFGTSQGNGLHPGVTLVATNYEPEKVKRFHAPVEKTIWGSPAGKKRLADRLVAMLPAHKTYVEPFAGSAAVLFAKEPSEVEVINDADTEISDAYRLLKKLSAEDVERLKKLPWVGDEKTFKRLFDAKPTGDVERLHRFLYLSHFSYGKLRGRSFSPSGDGVEATTVSRIEQFAPRLKRVKVYGGDYEKVVRKYDAKDTVFFLDPPYPGYNVDVGESSFDEERFFAVLKSLKGKFLLTYGIRGKLPALVKEAGFWVKRIRTPRTISAMRGVGGSSVLTQLVVANYEPATKALDEAVLLEDWDGSAEPDAEELEKAQPFGTFGGSFHYAKRIVPLIPPHRTYVEPFAGAAAVLHAKEPSDKEVLADLDEDVVFLHRAVKAMTPERVEELRRRFEWTVTEESFLKARDMAPRDELARFYKLVFVRTHARDCRPDGTHPAQQHLGSTTNPEKYLKAAERLRDVTILRQDYRKTLAAYDAPDTFFFVDPPYPGEWFDQDAVVNLDEFVDALAKVRGKFIAVLNPTPENVAAFKRVGHVFRLKVREASGRGGAKQAMRLFVANYPVRKCEEFELLDDAELAEAEKAPWSPSPDGALAFDKAAHLLKGLDPNDERYVLGIVLEPEVVDAQGDIYSPEEIRRAAHRFMEEFGGLGLMHRLRVNGQVKVLENYLAPTDFTVGDVSVRKGTWMLAVRVLSDELWGRVKSGDLTGFSIGGSARRTPEPEPAPQPAEAGAQPQGEAT